MGTSSLDNLAQTLYPGTTGLHFRGSLAPHRVGLGQRTLNCAGFYGHPWPAPHGSSSYYLEFIGSAAWTGPPDQVTRLSQGLTALPQGSVRQARSVRFIGPAPGRPDRCFTSLGFIGLDLGVGPKLDIHLGSPGRSKAGQSDENGAGTPTHADRPGSHPPLHSISSSSTNGVRLVSTPSAFSTGFVGSDQRAGQGGRKCAG